MYANFLTKTGTYGEDGINLLIELGWMEQPPKFEDRDLIAAKQ
nr:DUF3231 family protein [Bacillus sp. 1NLA3E]